MSALHLPQHGLNIDRSSLPQVQSKDVPDYLRWLTSVKHISYIHTEMPVAALYPSQGNFNPTKIKTFMTKGAEHLRKPIIVSADHYVMDGHHRWIALLNLDPMGTIPAILVHAQALDLIAATKSYPKATTKTVVESFRSIMEDSEKHVVLSFGRMNPPTIGHTKLVDKVHEVAQEHHAPHVVVLSHTQDTKKNPLSQAQKLKHAKRFFPNTKIIGSTPEHPTMFHHAAKLYDQGYSHLHVVVGSDRAKEFSEGLHKYNGKFDDEGHGYQFKSIQIHSAGERDPDSEGAEGMSASKMREYAQMGNFKEFKKGIPGRVTQEQAKDLYNDVRKGMGNLNESVEYVTEGVHDSAIFKAVFLAGAPGSGKDFVLKKSLDGHGLTEINSDTALEHLMDKHKLDKKMPESEQEKRNAIRDKAKSLTELRQRLALQGRNGLVINSTGASPDKIKKIKDQLEQLGYESKMIFVDASDNVSRNRNIERGQRGGRMIPEKIRAQKWREAQDARVKFSKMFGGEHYHEFNNDEDLRHQADPELVSQKTKELDGLFKTVRKFTQQPPQNPVAQQWVHTNLGKLAKQPVGNKKQQAAVAPPPHDSATAEEARKLGLTYLGYGRYGKGGRVTHFSLNGRLIEKKKALTPPKSLQATSAPSQPKKLNEAFEEFIQEEIEHVDLRLSDNVENHLLVGRRETQSQPRILKEFMQERMLDLSDGSTGAGSGCAGLSRLRSRSGGNQGQEAAQDLSEEVCQEDSKESLQAFKKRLVTEGEPTLDTGEEGGSPLGMGTGEKETLDMNRGGIAAKGPKKTFSELRKKK